MVSRISWEVLQMNKKSLPIVALLALVLAACAGGAITVTERNILEWGPVLNNFMATNMENANSFPESLNEIDPGIREHLSDRDGWGNKLLYRLLAIDRYNLISAGADGEFGNDDDIIMQNGGLYPAAEVYAKYPFKK
jgi:hypothetical protein